MRMNCLSGYEIMNRNATHRQALYRADSLGCQIFSGYLLRQGQFELMSIHIAIKKVPYQLNDNLRLGLWVNKFIKDHCISRSCRKIAGRWLAIVAKENDEERSRKSF
jgi:hypothetical protein